MEGVGGWDAWGRWWRASGGSCVHIELILMVVCVEMSRERSE